MPARELTKLDRHILDAARATVADAATLLTDLARRSPPEVAARLNVMVVELDALAHDLADWELLTSNADPSAYPQARGPTHD